MGAGISGLVTIQGVVARQPRPLDTLVLGLAVACQPRLGVLRGATLVLGLAVAVDSVSCPLFSCPFAVGPPPSPTTAFRTRWTWSCPKLPTGSISNSAKWLSI